MEKLLQLLVDNKLSKQNLTFYLDHLVDVAVFDHFEPFSKVFLLFTTKSTGKIEDLLALSGPFSF